MLIRSLASILVIASSFVLAIGQKPNAQTKDAKTATTTETEKLQDIPFPAGVNLAFLIKELARDMDLNVLFDPESRLEGRQVKIELKNVTVAQALNYIVLQEGLLFEEVGPKTMLVANRLRGTAIPHFGVGLTELTPQLAQYFGVKGGILVNSVLPDSAGAKAGLKAGDVIVGIDGESAQVAMSLISAIDQKKESDITLKIVRDHKAQTVTVNRPNTSP